MVCERVRLFPCRRSVPALSLQTNMSKKQPKRDRGLFDRCDHRFGRFLIPAVDRRCSCGTISIDDTMRCKTLIVVFGIVSLGLLAFAYAYFNSHKTPAGQPPLFDLKAQSLETFRTQFNA